VLADLAAALSGTLMVFAWPGLLWCIMRYYRPEPAPRDAGAAVATADSARASAHGHPCHLVVGGALVALGLLLMAFGVLAVMLLR
jgi:hypothetical protein